MEIVRTTYVIDIGIYEEYGESSKEGGNEMETYKYEDVWRVRDKQKMRQTHIKDTPTIHFRLSLT